LVSQGEAGGGARVDAFNERTGEEGREGREREREGRDAPGGTCTPCRTCLRGGEPTREDQGRSRDSRERRVGARGTRGRTLADLFEALVVLHRERDGDEGVRARAAEGVEGRAGEREEVEVGTTSWRGGGGGGKGGCKERLGVRAVVCGEVVAVAGCAAVHWLSRSEGELSPRSSPPWTRSALGQLSLPLSLSPSTARHCLPRAHTAHPAMPPPRADPTLARDALLAASLLAVGSLPLVTSLQPLRLQARDFARTVVRAALAVAQVSAVVVVGGAVVLGGERAWWAVRRWWTDVVAAARRKRGERRPPRPRGGL